MADEEAGTPPPTEELAAEQLATEGAEAEVALAEQERGEEAVASDHEGHERRENAPPMEDREQVLLPSAENVYELEIQPSIQTVSYSPSLTAQKRTEQSMSSIPRMPSIIRAERRAKYSSKAKMTLGSTIDIRRGTTYGEMGDRKAARYMNTYKMDSDNPFNPEKVEKILQAVMVEAMENLKYDGEKCPKQAKWASMAIRAKVKELDFDRYKIVCAVTIGEKNSQDVMATCRFLWDVERDRYAIFAMENTYVFGIAQCFGIYYE